jgi:hypothetical protein
VKPKFVKRAVMASAAKRTSNIFLRRYNMRKWIWAALLAVPLAVTGRLAWAKSQQANAGGFVCPITGEELPCPNCCPLNQGK